jgi:hypothetical protein
MKWLLRYKWWRTKQEKIKTINERRRTSKELFLKKQELYEKYLEAERQERSDDIIKLKAQLELLNWIIGLTMILLIFCPSVFAQEVIIRDRTTTGNKAEVEKVGTDYGLSTVMHSKKYMICNKDDDASPNYYGFEAADGSWYIMKWTVSAGADVFAYESGTSGYSTGWTARTTTNVYQSYGTEY